MKPLSRGERGVVFEREGELEFGTQFDPDIYLGGEDLRDLLRDFFTEHRGSIGGPDDRETIPVRMTVEVRM